MNKLNSLSLTSVRILIDALDLYIEKHNKTIPTGDRDTIDYLLSQLSSIAGYLSKK